VEKENIYFNRRFWYIVNQINDKKLNTKKFEQIPIILIFGYILFLPLGIQRDLN